VASYLLRGPQVRQARLHFTPQRGVRKLQAFRSGPAPYRLVIRAPRPVRLPAAIRSHFVRDGGCGVTHVTHNPAHRFASFPVATVLFTLGEGQVAFGLLAGPVSVLVLPFEQAEVVNVGLPV